MSDRNTDVPRLDLAPKLKQPLSLSKPLDYLRLLYWVFFFPQALRWYVYNRVSISERYKNPKKDSGLFLNPIITGLLIQVMVVIFLTLLTWSVILTLINCSVDAEYISVSFFVTILLCLITLASVLIEKDIFLSEFKSRTAKYLTIIIFLSLNCNLAIFTVSAIKEASTNLGLIGILGILAGMWLGVGGIATLAILEVNDLAIILVIGGVLLMSLMLCLYLPIEFKVTDVFVFLKSLLVRAFFFLSCVIGSFIGLLRPDNWFFTLPISQTLFKIELTHRAKENSSPRVLSNQFGSRYSGYSDFLISSSPHLPLSQELPSDYVFEMRKSYRNHLGLLFPRVTVLPNPYLTEQLKEWLRQDWETGIHNAYEIYTYTLQFIPVIQALNQVLAEEPEQVVDRIAHLTDHPYKWELVRFISGSIYTNFIQFDPPSCAVARGFLNLHKQWPYDAMKAFETVRNLHYGEEMWRISLIMFIYQDTMKLKDIAALSLYRVPEKPWLRSDIWKAIFSLYEIIGDIQFIQNSSSRSARASALSHALGELKNLRDRADAVPQPEREIVRKIAWNWSKAILDVASEVGNVSITERVRNPYVVGDPVEGNLFVGREDILKQLKEVWILSKQLQSVVIYGHRRMGKTSILLNAAKSLGSQVKVAYVNLLRLGNIPQGVGEVLMAISDQISDAVNIPPPADEDLLNLPYRTFERYLKQVEANLSETGLIIALDEFEKIEKLIENGKIDTDFMEVLRGMVQMSPKIAFALAGLHTLDEMTGDYSHPFFASFINIKVSFMESAATRQILTNPNKDFLLDYAPEALSTIYGLTTGQPYLVQLVGFQLVRRYNDQVFENGNSRDPVFTVEDVRAVINDPEFFQRGRYYFDGVWGQGAQDAPGQQEVLRAIAPHPEGLDINTLAEITGMNETNLQQALNSLIRHDVVWERDGKWRIIVELFRHWVLSINV
ncbi:ATP-binding protein [Microcoleus sp. D3_18a_C4]|uniref:ATP-binding protein n=1 Tax=Microcoleus sp. D3_18a_C4 TaxID=3055332 RepID=UPI002FCFA3F5